MEKFPTRYVNLRSFMSVLNKENQELIECYINSYSNSFPKKKKSKRNIMNLEEIRNANSLFEEMASNQKITEGKLEGYILNYTFYSGVREEFDILRFGKKYNLNIELKSSIPEKDIKKQLISHKRLLEMLNKSAYLFTYISSDQKIYRLDESNQLVSVDVEDIVDCIEEEWEEKNYLNDLDLSDNIISPYSDPEKFINHEYYLTTEQMDIEKKILNIDYKLISLVGGPGSGKTLLLFDMAKKMTEKSKKVLVVLGAQMTEDESKKLTEIMKFDVEPIKNVAFEEKINDYDVVFFDESQRIWKEQFEWIISLKKPVKIFVGDQRQTFHQAEKNENIQKKLVKLGAKEFKLSLKVRSNPEMSSFIQKLLDVRAKNVSPFNYENVDAVFFDNVKDAQDFSLYQVRHNGFRIIEPTEYRTKSTYSLKRKKLFSFSLDVHKTIGREYDKVLIPLDNNFYYDNNGKLSSSYSEYYPYIEGSLLFESLTRVKKELTLVVIDNERLYKTILEILSWKIDTLVKNDE